MAEVREEQRGEQRVTVRSVWAWNVEFEFSIIASLVRDFPCVALDTEFPGAVYRSNTPHRLLSPEQHYRLLKANVDSLKLIQVGLTLFDADGNLPDLGTGGELGFVWEFNFRDFNLRRDLYAPDSIKLLLSCGIDFDTLLLHGIASDHFASLLYRSGLVPLSPLCPRLSAEWITFSGCYDFGYLIKILGRGRPLPNTLDDFLHLINVLFGMVIDVKYMIRHCDGLYGGLETVASTLKVARSVGSSHHAGSDSLLTCQAFLKIRDLFFHGKDEEVAEHEGVLYGLHDR